MITIETKMINKFSYTVCRNLVRIAKGSVQFSTADEQDKAEAAIKAEVAKIYGCEEKELMVCFFPY